MKGLIGLSASVALAALCAMTTVGAQGNQGNGQPVGGTQAVGSLTIASLSIANAPIYGFGFSLEAQQGDSTGGGGSAGKTQFGTIDLVRTPDSASPALFATAATGRHLPEAQIVVGASTAGGADSLYRLRDVFITRLGNDNGVERLSLTYGRIEVHAGSGSFCYDVKFNTPC